MVMKWMAGIDVLECIFGGAPSAQNCISAFLTRFNPKSVLDESRWSMGEVSKDSAVILLRYQKSENDAHLKMFYETGDGKSAFMKVFHPVSDRPRADWCPCRDSNAGPAD